MKFHPIYSIIIIIILLFSNLFIVGTINSTSVQGISAPIFTKKSTVNDPLLATRYLTSTNSTLFPTPVWKFSSIPQTSLPSSKTNITLTTLSLTGYYLFQPGKSNSDRSLSLPVPSSSSAYGWISPAPYNTSINAGKWTFQIGTNVSTKPTVLGIGYLGVGVYKFNNTTRSFNMLFSTENSAINIFNLTAGKTQYVNVTENASQIRLDQNQYLFIEYYLNVTLFAPASNVSVLFEVGGANGSNDHFTYPYYGWIAGSVSPSSAKVTVNGSAVSVVNGAFNYTVMPGTYYVNASALYYTNFSVLEAVISTQTTTINIVLHRLYNLTFTESGLPSGTLWNVTLNGLVQENNSPTIVFTAPNGNYSFIVSNVSGYTSNPHSGSVSVNYANVYEAITFVKTGVKTYNVTFKEYGLPSGTSWIVTLNGTPQSSATTTITIMQPNGTYNFTVQSPINGSAGVRFVANVSNGSVHVNNSEPFIYIGYKTQYYLTMSSYPINGGSVSPSSSWYNESIILNIKAVPNQGFIFKFWSGSGTGNYSGSNASATIMLAGPITEIANFVAIYTITFTESGLPAGTSWWVNLSSTNKTSSSAQITFNETNGSYSYTLSTPISGFKDVRYVATGSGSVNVNGSNRTVSVLYTTQYYLTMLANPAYAGKVAPGSGWYNNGTTILISTTNNSGYSFYNWTGHGSGSYTGFNGSAKIVITDPISETANFVKLYFVSVIETGLSTNTSWFVTLNGVTKVSKSNVIEFTVPNGTYSYTVGSVAGYKSSNSSGIVSVNNNNITLTIHFSKLSAQSSAFSIPYLIMSAAVTALAGLLIFYFFWPRKSAITDIFILYKDGRLIKHFTNRIKPEIDQDLFSNTLLIIQKTMKDVYEGKDIKEISLQQSKILLFHGKYLFAAVIGTPKNPEKLMKKLKRVVINIELMYAKRLSSWNGDFSQMKWIENYKDAFLKIG